MLRLVGGARRARSLIAAPLGPLRRFHLSHIQRAKSAKPIDPRARSLEEAKKLFQARWGKPQSGPPDGLLLPEDGKQQSPVGGSAAAAAAADAAGDAGVYVSRKGTLKNAKPFYQSKPISYA